MTVINALPAQAITAALRRNITRPPLFHDQYFGHSAMATKLAMTLRQSRLFCALNPPS
jgi:hypothetical protein